jgi:hypothetical protein
MAASGMRRRKICAPKAGRGSFAKLQIADSAGWPYPSDNADQKLMQGIVASIRELGTCFQPVVPLTAPSESITIIVEQVGGGGSVADVSIVLDIAVTDGTAY